MYIKYKAYLHDEAYLQLLQYVLNNPTAWTKERFETETS